MLNITDLDTSRELDGREMAGVRGGVSELERLSALIDFSTSIYNKVADVNQGFGFNLAQGKVSAASMLMTGQRPEMSGKGITMTVMVETYAVLALLVS